jgi:hypothetical protein
LQESKAKKLCRILLRHAIHFLFREAPSTHCQEESAETLRRKWIATLA